jgi:Flp pilus assembly protein TadG
VCKVGSVTSAPMFWNASLPGHRTPSTPPRAAGQAIVELAILLPLILLILLGAIDFGRVFILTTQLENAAREGAAYGAVKPTDAAGITSAARQELGGDTAVSISVSCSTTCTSSSAAAGNTITVQAQRTFAFVTPFMASVLGGPLTPSMSATAVIQ